MTNGSPDHMMDKALRRINRGFRRGRNSYGHGADEACGPGCTRRCADAGVLPAGLLPTPAPCAPTRAEDSSSGMRRTLRAGPTSPLQAMGERRSGEGARRRLPRPASIVPGAFSLRVRAVRMRNNHTRRHVGRHAPVALGGRENQG